LGGDFSRLSLNTVLLAVFNSLLYFCGMRCLTVILLVFLANFVCLGNKVNKNLVTKVDSLGNELQKSKDSISSLTKELTVLKADLEKVKTRSEAFDESVWEYGSSLVGIILSVTVLFGLFYYMSSQQANEQAKQAASDAFVDNFDVYKSMIKEKYKGNRAAYLKDKNSVGVPIYLPSLTGQVTGTQSGNSKDEFNKSYNEKMDKHLADANLYQERPYTISKDQIGEKRYGAISGKVGDAMDAVGVYDSYDMTGNTDGYQGLLHGKPVTGKDSGKYKDATFPSIAPYLSFPI